VVTISDKILPEGYRQGRMLANQPPIEVYEVTRDGNPTLRLAMVQGSRADQASRFLIAKLRLLDLPQEMENPPFIVPEECRIIEEGEDVVLRWVDRPPDGFRAWSEIQKESKDPATLRQLLGQFASLLRNLHEADIFHGDISPESLLVRVSGSLAPGVLLDRLSWQVARRLIAGEEDDADALEKGKNQDIRAFDHVVGRALPDIKKSLDEDDPRSLEQLMDLLAQGVEPAVSKPVAEDQSKSSSVCDADHESQPCRETSLRPASSSVVPAHRSPADFFVEDLAPAMLSWRDDFSIRLEDWENKFCIQLIDDRDASFALLIEILDEVEVAVNQASGDDYRVGRNIVGLILDELCHLGVQQLPLHRFDFDLSSLKGHDLFGLSCQYEYCEGPEYTRPGSIMRTERIGLVRHGTVLREGRVVISLGVKPEALTAIEGAIRRYSEADYPVCLSLKQFVQWFDRRGSEPEPEGFVQENRFLALADTVTEILDAYDNGDSVLDDLPIESLLPSLLANDGFVLYPQGGYDRLRQEWGVELDECEGVFDLDRRPGQIVSVESLGLQWQGRKMRNARIRIGLGTKPSAVERVEQLIDASTALPAVERWTESLKASRTILVRRQLAQVLGLVEIGEECGSLLQALVEGLNLAVAAGAEIDHCRTLAEAVEVVLTALDESGKPFLVPTPAEVSCVDTPANDDRCEVQDGPYLEELDALHRITVISFGWVRGGRIQQKAKVEIRHGARAEPVHWIQRLLAQLPVESYPSVHQVGATLRLSFLDWCLAPPSSKNTARQVMLNLLLDFLQRIDTILGGDDLAVGVRERLRNIVANNLDDRVGGILGIQPIPAFTAYEDSLNSYPPDAFESIQYRFDEATSKGYILKVPRRGYRDGETSQIIRKASVVVSRGTEKENSLVVKCINVAHETGVDIDSDLAQSTQRRSAEGKDLTLDQWIRLSDVLDSVFSRLEGGVSGSPGEFDTSDVAKLLHEIDIVVSKLGVARKPAPAAISDDTENHDFELQWLYHSEHEVGRVIETLRTHWLRSETQEVVRRGAMVVSRGPHPHLLKAYNDDPYWSRFGALQRWKQQATQSDRRRPVEIDDLWKSFVDTVGQEMESRKDEFRKCLQAVADLDGLCVFPKLGESITAYELGVECEERRQSNEQAGVILEVKRWGLRRGDEVLTKAVAIVSAGATGGLLSLGGQLLKFLRPGNDGAEVAPGDLVLDAEAMSQRHRKELAERPERIEDPELVLELLEFGQRVGAAQGAHQSPGLPKLLDSCVQLLTKQQWRVVPESRADVDINRCADFVTVLRACQTSTGMMDTIIMRSTVFDAHGEVRQRGQILVPSEAPQELADCLYRLLGVLQKHATSGNLCLQILSLAARVPGAPDGQINNSIALQPINALYEAYRDDTITWRQYLDYTNELRMGFLKPRGCVELPVKKDDLARNRRMIQVKDHAGMIPPNAKVTAVLRPAFGFRGPPLVVIQRALVRID